MDLEHLGREIDRYGTRAYLVTVTHDGRPHLSPADVAFDGAAVSARTASGSKAARFAATDALVCLHWPPGAGHDGYSLIVDGTPTVSDDGAVATIRVAPTRAVLHKPLPGPLGDVANDVCGHDCREV